MHGACRYRPPLYLWGEVAQPLDWLYTGPIFLDLLSLCLIASLLLYNLPPTFLGEWVGMNYLFP